MARVSSVTVIVMSFAGVPAIGARMMISLFVWKISSDNWPISSINFG